ncbi:MAG: cell division protein FtsX [Alphaproteobacteria bacterium]
MRRRADIPFEDDLSSRFLPAIVALMVFLGMLGMALAVGVGGIVAAWDTDLVGRLTVQVPDDAGAGSARLQRVEQALRATPGVAAVRTLSAAETQALVEPWLGRFSPEAGLPLPRVIDVELVPGAAIDTAALAARLAGEAPGIVVDDHRDWLGRLVALARTVEAVAYVVLALIAAAAVATVVFATRSGLAVHAPTVELLHLMGATDGYVAGQFQRHAMRAGALGAAIGSGLALLALAALAAAAWRLEAAFLPVPRVGPHEAILLAMVPVVAVVIVMITARATALRALADLP